MTQTRRRGVTLIELLVTIAVIGILSSVAVVSLIKAAPPNPNDPAVVAERLRRDALRDGSAKSAVVIVDSMPVELTAFPDGSIAADSALGADRLTGQVPHAKP